MNACDGIEACRLGRQKFYQHSMVLLETFTNKPPHTGKPSDSNTLFSALFTEHKRWNNIDRHKKNKKRVGFKDKKCTVCDNFKCWSTNHTMGERLAAFERNKKARVLMVVYRLAEEGYGSAQGRDLSQRCTAILESSADL